MALEDWLPYAIAIAAYGLPANLKLSVHSGSDKFSIYRPIHASMKKFCHRCALEDRRHHMAGRDHRPCGSGGDGLALAKEIYAEAFAHRRNFARLTQQ